MKKIVLIFAVASLVLVSCKEKNEKMDAEEVVENIEKEIVEAAKIKQVAFNLESKSGSTAVGKVVFIEDGGVVKITATLSGLSPGTHAIHIHEKADCTSADGKSSGGHWNPTFAPHGKWGDEGGYHSGDIGNFEADDSGNGSISLKTDKWCIGCDDETKNILGKAIVVHQGTDDYTSQPSGDAGARVSCGGIIE